MSDPYDQLFDSLQTVYRALVEEIRRQDRDQEMPYLSVMVLGKIGKHPGITVSELARRLSMAKSHASELVEDLARKGLVGKQPDPNDKRLLRLFLSAAGEAILQEGRATVRRRFLEVIAGLPESQAQRIAQDMQALHAVIVRNRSRESGSGSAL